MYNLVGVDIDGVLSDIAGHLVEFAEKMFGFRLSLADLTSENVETCSPLTRTQLEEIFSSSVFFQSLPSYKSAGKSLKQLRQCGMSVILMTDRFWYSGIQTDTWQWLKSNNIPFDGLYFVSKLEKAKVAQKLGIDIFIEDQLSNANALAKVCQKVFLIDRPYNQGLTQGSVIRVCDLDQAVSMLVEKKVRSAKTQSA